MSFFPLDRDISTSSLWIQGSPVQLKVFLYLLLRADPRTGVVPDSDPAIAHSCAMPIDETLDALEWLSSPDPYSRTKSNDGRRVERTEEGRWRVLNYEAFASKDYSTQRVKRFRERRRETPGNEVKRSETECNAVKRPSVTETTNTDTNKNTEKEKKDPPLGELVLTHETPTVEAPPSPNPARFIAYWQDANEHRDFGLRLQPEASFREFLANEAVRLEWSRDGPDFERFVAGSLERFKAHYSKRGGKKRATRGKSLKPQQLTEELVAWIRSDLAEQQKRDAVRFKSQAERVDESVARLAKGDNAEQWRTEDEIEPGTPSGALSGLLRDR